MRLNLSEGVLAVTKDKCPKCGCRSVQEIPSKMFTYKLCQYYKYKWK